MLERRIDFVSILSSNENSVLSLRENNYEQMFSFATACAKNYLEYAYPNNVGIAAQFVADLIDTRQTWKLADFVNLFKFFRQRQDIAELKVFGNVITGTKLMEMTAIYEEYRAQEHENIIKKAKSEYLEQNKNINPLAEKLAAKLRDGGHSPTGDIQLGKIMERQREVAERVGYGKNTTPRQNHNDFFENNH